MSDQLLLLCEHKLLHKLLQLSDRHRRDLRDIFICYRDGQRRLFQTLPATGLTRCDPHEALILLLHCVRSGLPVTPLHIFDQSLKGNVINAFAALPLVVHLHFPAVCAVNQHILNMLRQLLKRSRKVKLILLCQCIQNRTGKAALVRAGLPSCHNDRTILNTQGAIRYHQINVKLHLIAEAIAVRAGSERIVERKAARLDLLNTDPAVRAGKALAEAEHAPAGCLPAVYLDKRKAIGEMQYIFH